MGPLHFKKNPLSESSLVDVAMLHPAVSYDPTPQHIYLDVRMNDEGNYHHYLISKNMSTINCYNVCKKGGARYDNKVKTG